jgi:hypothetical protein
MSKDNVEVVIIPGSFATAPPYEVLVEGLKARGYKARVVPLLSVNDGTRLPPATMQDDAAEIRSAVQSILDDPDHPRNVVLVVHSYSGFPGTEAVAGLSRAARSSSSAAVAGLSRAARSSSSAAVVGILYMAALLPQAGQSARDIIRTNPNAPEEFKVSAPGTYYPAMPAESAPFIFNDGVDPDEAVRLLATFSRHSADSYDGKLSHAAWRDIPSVQIIPSIDLVVPVAIQEAMYEKVREVAPEKFRQVRYEGAGHGFCFHGVWIERTVEEIVQLAEANL